MSERLMKDRVTHAELGMTPDEIRATASAMDDLAKKHCPEGCRPDLVIGAAIDHLYAMAAAEEYRPRSDSH